MIKMNIALTGASGSIGKELLPFLKSLGHNVFVISSSITSNGMSHFSYKELKARNLNVQIDIFFHLATINSNLAEKDIHKEIQLTKDIIFALPSLDCKKLIFFSSAKVYGDNSFSSANYDELCDAQPICAYGKAKKLCEETIQLESENIGINSIIFRLPPVLNQSLNSNLGKLIKLSKLGIPMPMLIEGSLNQRSFLSFNNLETVINFFLENQIHFSQNQIYNMADYNFISLNNLLKIFGGSFSLPIPKFLSKFLFRVPFLKLILLKLYGNFVLDNSKLQSVMGVKLKTTLESLPIIYK